MAQRSDQRQPRGAVAPEGAFVVQLRSDSDPSKRRLRGRVEHVMSGQSEPFTSLNGLLTFIARYAGSGVAPNGDQNKEERHDR